MTHEVEIKYRLPPGAREKLLTRFGADWPVHGSMDRPVDGVVPDGVAEWFENLAQMGLPVSDESGKSLQMRFSSWCVLDRYYFDSRHLLFRVRMQFDSAMGWAHWDITHKQADGRVGEALNRMETEIRMSPMGLKDGDSHRVLQLLSMVNCKTALVMRK